MDPFRIVFAVFLLRQLHWIGAALAVMSFVLLCWMHGALG